MDEIIKTGAYQMKIQDKRVVGDLIIIDDYTSEWFTVNLHPTIFYRRMNEIQNSYKNVKGLYSEEDMGQYIVIRFLEKDDLTAFRRYHHEYI